MVATWGCGADARPGYAETWGRSAPAAAASLALEAAAGAVGAVGLVSIDGSVTQEGSGVAWCTGVLIDADLVLTSGRCEPPQGGHHLAAFVPNPQAPERRASIAWSVRHPAWQRPFCPPLDASRPGSARQLEACEALRTAMRLPDLGALRRLGDDRTGDPPPLRADLLAMDPVRLRAAGLIGVQAAYDVAILGLAEPLAGATTAPPATGDQLRAAVGSDDDQQLPQSPRMAPPVALRWAAMQADGAGPRVGAHDAVLAEIGTVELATRAAAEQAGDADEAGAALFWRGAGDGGADLLVGIGSRRAPPLGPAEAGAVVALATRADVIAPWIAVALESADEQGLRAAAVAGNAAVSDRDSSRGTPQPAARGGCRAQPGATPAAVAAVARAAWAARRRSARLTARAAPTARQCLQ